MNPFVKKALLVLGLLLFLFTANQLVSSNSLNIGVFNKTMSQLSYGNQGTGFGHEVLNGLSRFYSFTGIRNAKSGNIIMILVGIFFIFLAIKYVYEPLLLIPIGAGIIIGNIPFFHDGGMNLHCGIYQDGSVLRYLYLGVLKGIFPPLIFLGIGAMTDFSSLISNPRLILLVAAAQLGIFITFLGAIWL